MYSSMTNIKLMVKQLKYKCQFAVLDGMCNQAANVARHTIHIFIITVDRKHRLCYRLMSSLHTRACTSLSLLIPWDMNHSAMSGWANKTSYQCTVHCHSCLFHSYTSLNECTFKCTPGLLMSIFFYSY